MKPFIFKSAGKRTKQVYYRTGCSNPRRGVGATREFDVALFSRRAKHNEFILGDTDYHYEQVACMLKL